MPSANGSSSLIRSLLRGNVQTCAGPGRTGAGTSLHAVGRQIAVQNLIEDLAQGQAIRNAFINLPSAVPGIGTIISWVLISVEDFFTLDQGVTLILAVERPPWTGSGRPPRNGRISILILGEAYGLEAARVRT
ncbi:MAG: hypothetical protein MZU95_09560 [Desulfomicrobium escambiense]|nr:hypothetical protein [Desulfomicrobium escambiense]